MMRPLLFATNYYVVADLQIQWIARMMYFQALSLASKNSNTSPGISFRRISVKPIEPGA